MAQCWVTKAKFCILALTFSRSLGKKIQEQVNHGVIFLFVCFPRINPELAAGSISIIRTLLVFGRLFFHELVTFAILEVSPQLVGQLIINMVCFDLETLYGFSKLNAYDVSDCMCCLVYKKGERNL